MRKPLALTAIAVAVGLVLTGCSEAAEEGPVVVKVWVPTSGENTIDEAFVEKFNTENTDVQIEYTTIASDRATQDIILALRTGEGPDVFIGPSPAEFINPGFALALDGLLDEDILAAYDGYLAGSFDYVVDDKLYEIPLRFNGTRMLINRDLFEQAGLDPDSPPTTFSEVIDAANAITKSSGGKAYGFGLPLAFAGAYQNHIEPLAMASNPNLTRVNLFDTKEQEFDSQAFAPVIDMYRTLIADGSMYPGTGTLDRDALRAAFANGEVGMYIGSSIELGVLNGQLKSDVAWSAEQIPVADGTSFVRSSGTVSGGPAVNAATKNKDASLKVIQAWMGYERICEIVKAGIIVPLRNDVADCLPQGLVGYDQFFPTDTSGDVPDAVAPGNSLTVSGAPYETVIAELVLGDADLKTALADLAGRYDAAYKKAVDSGELNADNFR